MMKGVDIPIAHSDQSLQNIMYLLMNLIGCILFSPKLFYTFAWLNMICVSGATVAILFWGSKKSNVEYVTSNVSAQNFDEQDFE